MEKTAENFFAEVQADFRPNQSTVEQIGNGKIQEEKFRDHQLKIHHNFIDFKKIFERV